LAEIDEILASDAVALPIEVLDLFLEVAKHGALVEKSLNSMRNEQC